jgi:hypothetical protein
MKGTIVDFLKLAAEQPDLAKELVELAGRYDFEFSDEVSDEALDSVAGGLSVSFTGSSIVTQSGSSTSLGSPDICFTPTGPSPAVPTPYPNIGETDDDGTSTKGTTTTKG